MSRWCVGGRVDKNRDSRAVLCGVNGQLMRCGI